MKKNKVKIFSASEKTGIVLELIKEESTLGQLASKYAISSETIQNWKKQFLGNAALAFEPAKVLSEYQEQINHLQEQNDELAKALSRITVERDWAVGKLKSLDLSNKKSLVHLKLNQLPKSRQCELLKISRSTAYYKSKEMSINKLSILNRIDEIYEDDGYRSYLPT